MATQKVPTLDGSGRVRQKHLPAHLTPEAQNVTYATPTQFELVPIVAYGTSWVNGGFGVSNGTRHMDRVAARLRSLTYNNQGVSGSKMGGIADRAIATYTPGAWGLVLAEGTINDQANMHYGAALNGPATTAEALRAFLAHVTAGASYSADSARFAYKGSGWSSGVTSTAGESVDVAFTGDSAYLLTRFVSGTGATITATNTGTGAQLAQVTTGGYIEEIPGVIKVSGLGAGAHTVRFTLTSGSGLNPRALLVPNPAPPTVVWFEEGPVSASGADTYAGWNYPARLANYHAAQAPILASFPTVVVVTVGSEWTANPAAMMSTDGLHPNARGHGHIADRIEQVLRTRTWRAGQAQIGDPFVDVAALPAYVVGSTTAPAAPAGFSASGQDAGVQLNWLPTANGGAAITDYAAQWSTDGTTWNTFTHTASTTLTTTITGLTNGTTYQVRAALVNSVGTGPWVTLTGIVAGIPGGYTSIDTFDRADSTNSLGSTSAGGFAWTVQATTSASFGISSNQAYASAVSGEGIATINDGLANFSSLEATITAKVNGSTGVAFRYVDSANFWLVYVNSSGNWQLLKKVGGGFSTLSTGPAAAVGDSLLISASGSTVNVKVNGVQQMTATDAFQSTATKKGLWVGAGGTASRFDNFKTKA